MRSAKTLSVISVVSIHVQRCIQLIQAGVQGDAGGAHLGAGAGGGVFGDGPAGRQVDVHREAGAAQLQGGGLHAVVQGQAADQYAVDIIVPEKLDDARAALLGQVVVAGAVG